MNDTTTKFDQALEYYVQGFRLHGVYTKRTNREARNMFKEAIRLRPDFARAYAHLSYSLLVAWYANWIDPDNAEDAEISLDGALKHAREAVRIDGNDYDNRWSLAQAYLYSRQFDVALEEFRIALSFAEKEAIPFNYAGLLVDRAEALCFAGEPGREMVQQAITDTREGMRAMAKYTKRYFWTLGWAYYEAGYYEEEQENSRNALNALLQIRNPHDQIRKNILLNYVVLGLIEPAKRMTEEFLTRNPDYTLAVEDKRPYRDENRRLRLKAHLKEAGMPGDVTARI